MTDYFKATRTDGKDFYSGTIDYAAALASGEVIRHPVPKKVRDDAATYISVSVSTADCTGFSWPCRLFRVEPVGRIMGTVKRPLSASRSKRAVSALRVVEELPAWQAFGPNGEQVVRIIEQASRLTADQAKALHAAWYAAWDAARDAARYAAGDAARDAARYAAWYAARYAAWDAAGACVVRDRLTDEQFRLLAGPWISVMGDPA